MPATFVWDSSVSAHNFFRELDRRVYMTSWSLKHQQVGDTTFTFTIRHSNDGWWGTRYPAYTQPTLHGLVCAGGQGCRITAHLKQRDTINYLKITLFIIMVFAFIVVLSSTVCLPALWTWYTILLSLASVAFLLICIGVFLYTRKNHRYKQLLMVSQAARANYTIVPPEENLKGDIG